MAQDPLEWITMNYADVLRQIKSGRPPGETLIDYVTQTGMQSFLADVRQTYRYVFQEKRQGNKLEVALSRTCDQRLREVRIRRSLFPVLMLTPVFRGCLFVVGEQDRLTSVAIVRSVAVRPARKPGCFVFTMGTGFYLLLDLEEWCIQPMGS